LSGCGIFKNINRTKEKIITVTEKFIDTNLVLIYDTVPIFDTVPIYDTAFLEIRTASARSYWNPKMNKIVLELKGKEFDVPIKIHQKEIKTDEVKKVEKNPNEKIIIFIALIFAGMIILLSVILFIIKQIFKT
jgi:hypothetical protein